MISTYAMKLNKKKVGGGAHTTLLKQRKSTWKNTLTQKLLIFMVFSKEMPLVVFISTSSDTCHTTNRLCIDDKGNTHIMRVTHIAFLQ